MTNDADDIAVEGHTFWRSTKRGKTSELNTKTEVEIRPGVVRWVCASLGDRSNRVLVQSQSPGVQQFLESVENAMQVITRRATVRPVPKPAQASGDTRSLANLIPCPRCQGEAWPDCEFCDGAGMISKRQK